MLDITGAITAVKELVATDVDPVLSDLDVQAALLRTQIAATWVTATAYAAGAVIIPTVPLGRRYRCVLAGTSGTTEPTWLIAPPYTGPVNPLAGQWWGMGPIPIIDTVTATPWFWGLADGTAAWRDYGPFAGELFDVRGAAYQCWMLKAQRASNQPKRKRVGPLLQDYMTYEQCVAQARRFAPVGFG